MMFILAKEFFDFGNSDSLNTVYISFALSFIVMPLSTIFWCGYYEKYGKGSLVDRTIKLWDLATGGFIKTLNGHRDFVYSVAISPDVKTIVSGSGKFVYIIIIYSA